MNRKEKHRVITKEDVFALEANNTIPGVIILELPQRENGGVLVSWEGSFYI